MGSTELLQRLGIKYPIILGPFGGGLSTARLVAVVSNGGGLGSYGAHVTAPERMTAVADEIRALTNAPFAMNLWVSDHDPGGLVLSREEFDRAYELFAPYFRELGVDKPEMPQRFHPSFDQQIEALLEARPPAFSFVFGIPPARILAECRRRGIVTIGAATSVAEAVALEDAKVDAIVATGFEAGGHRPSFLARAEESLFGTFALTQLVAAHVSVPVISAGGIADAKGIGAALALGARGAQIGTAFLACAESGTSDEYRALLLSGRKDHTVLTRTLTGRLARGYRNRWVEEMEQKALPPFPVLGWFASQLRPAALKAGRTDLVSLWAGQIAPNLQHRSAAELMRELVEELAGGGRR